jgi:hypothetical protein
MPRVTFGNKLLFFYGEELLAPHPTPKLVDRPLSADRDCLFNILAATLHIWRSSPPDIPTKRKMKAQITIFILENSFCYITLWEQPVKHNQCNE